MHKHSPGKLSITPSAATIQAGESIQLSLSGGGSAKWRSLNPAVATVSSTGVAFGVTAGLASIDAKRGGATAPPMHLAVTGGPVHCELSDWSAWARVPSSESAWSTCANGVQSRTYTETRSRTITQEPSAGGDPCGALEETRTAIESQTCTVEPLPPSGKTLLSRFDFTYLGCMRAKDSSDFIYGGFTGRQVNGQTRLLFAGNPMYAAGCEILEMADTGVYNREYTAAPQMARTAYHGDVYGDCRQSWEQDKDTGAWVPQLPQGRWYPLDLHWHEPTQMLYWGFYEPYTVSGNWFSLGGSRLNADGTWTPFGPWKIRNRNNRYGHRAAAWMGAHSDGSMLIGGGWSSGIAALSWGPDLSGGLPFPTGSTPSGMESPVLNALTKYMTYYYPVPPASTFKVRPVPGLFSASDADNYVTMDGNLVGQLRSFKRPLGDYVFCQQADYIGYVDPLKVGYGSWTQIDGQRGFVWIDTPAKHGIVHLAALGGNGLTKGNPTEYAAGHIYYRNLGMGNDACEHGFIPEGDATTGPTTTAAHAAMFLINPDDVQRVASGEITDYSVHPYDHINLETEYGLKVAPTGTVGMGHSVSSGYFDPLTKKLYVMANGADDGLGQVWLTPLIHVFEVHC